MAEEEKTEKATPKRRTELRQKGDVARSAEVNTVIMMAVALMTLMAFGGHPLAHGHRKVGSCRSPRQVSGRPRIENAW